MSEPDPIIITGPTASGKGKVAFELARRIGGEIIVLDSMKVYRELDVATAKPSSQERSEVRHHLLDVIDPEVEFSVADYLRLLSGALEDVASRGRPAVLTGGTALYLKAYLEGLRTGPPANWDVRNRLVDEARQLGVEALHVRLQARDAEAARRIHSRDVRRIVRALEVLEASGQPLSAGWEWGGKESRRPRARIFGIHWERADLYRRINRRVEMMVEAGLFEEALRLRERRPPLGRTASQAIGYKQIWEGLSQGRSQADVVLSIQQSSRRFAKSQLTWFRKLPITWIPAAQFPDAVAVQEEIQRRLE